MIDKAIFALPGAKRALGILCALIFVRALLVIGQGWGLASAVVNLVAGAAFEDSTLFLVVFLICFVGRQITVYAQDSYLDAFTARRVAELREELLSTVFAHGAHIVQKQGTGSVSALALEGIDQVDNYLRLVLPKIAAFVIIPPVVLVFVFPHDWVSGLIMLVMFPTIIFFMVLLGNTAKAMAERQHGEFRVLSNHFVDSLRGIDTLKLFGRAKAYGSRIFEVSERFRQATMRTLRVAILSGVVIDLASTASLAAVSIMLGFRLVDGSVSFFPALLTLILVPEYFKPIKEFSSDFHASLDGRNSLASINALIKEGRALVDARSQQEDGRIAPWNEHSRFEMCEISFSYQRAAQEGGDAPAGAPATNMAPTTEDATGGDATGSDAPVGHGARHRALDKISFAVEGCQRVGIVGVSGSGKSTLINLIGGFIASEVGEFSVGGVSTSDLRRADWQQQVTYIPQNPYIFHATLRDNIAFYRSDASDADIAEAASVAGLDELIAELPDGLETVVGEGARPLSGGEAQRVAIARIMLDRSRRILLFDEPTAHLDIETELELKERMLPLMENRLVFFATHRLHWVHDMDYVLVLEQGRIAQAGTPAELTAQDGAFLRLVAAANGEGTRWAAANREGTRWGFASAEGTR